MLMYSNWKIRISSIAGAPTANAAIRIRQPRAIALARLWASKISMTTATGVPRQSTGTYGIRELQQGGRLTIRGTGHGLIRGDGHGSTRINGDMRPSTTGVGLSSVAAGAGSQDRVKFVRCTRLPWLRSSVELESESAET